LIDCGIRFDRGEFCVILEGAEILRSPSLRDACERGFSLLPPRPAPAHRETAPVREAKRAPIHAAYQLASPHGVYVGYGTGNPPWADLWAFRQHVPGPLGDWLRSLDECPECDWWRLGLVRFLPRALIRSAWTDRLTYLREQGVPLLNPPPSRPQRLIRVRPDGVDHYASYKDAARQTGIARRHLMVLAESNRVDRVGHFWTLA
jgi:hypothetical protein